MRRPRCLSSTVQGLHSMHACSHADRTAWGRQAIADGRGRLLSAVYSAHQGIMFQASCSHAVRLAAVYLALMNPWTTLTST